MAAPRRADRLVGIESQSPSSRKKRNTSSSMCDTSAKRSKLLEEQQSVDPSTAYRQCLKQNNPKKYKAYLDEQKIRSKAYRDEVKSDQEKLQALREKAKLRQKKFREKKKRECIDNNCAKTSTPGQDDSTSKGPRTKAESVNQQQKWREAKRKYREKLSARKKMWIKRKDKERKKTKQNKTETLPSEKEMNQGFKSKKTLYNVTSFARKSIPQSPQKFAQVIKSLVNNTTPRKKEAAQRALEKKYQVEMKECSSEKHTTNVIQEQTEELKEESSGNTTKQHKKKNVCTKRQQYYYLRQKTLCKVKHFFIREDIATPLPQKRYASKHGPGYVMQVTLLVAFTLFKKENPDCRIGLTKFTALRPKKVRLLTTRHWNYCVCLICQNVSYKLKTLNRFLPEKIKDFNQLLDVILSPKK